MSDLAGAHEQPAAQERPPRRSGPRPWLQLFRLPNVFTAFADIGMGYAFTHEGLDDWRVLALLLAGSGLMYTAGMVLNDVYDVEIDARERPFRPLPSGRIPLRLAAHVGWEMLLLGAACAWAAGALAGATRCGIVATALAIAVVSYDKLLKRTPAAPLAMGACRTLNVLLGMSALSGGWQTPHLAIALGLGTYIVGVTWFARTEAVESRQASLAMATCVVFAGLAIVTLLPYWDNAEPPLARFARGLGNGWHFLCAAMAAAILRRCVRAVLDPSPALVQAAVKNCIWSLIILDAVVCVAARGPLAGLAIVALLAPAMLLGRWIYAT